MNSLPIPEIEEKVRNRTHNLSEVHGYGHLKRTAIGAKFFARFFGESEQNQDIAYIAGLIHDLERPNTEKIDHADISVREASKFLSYFSLDQEIQDKIILLIQTHRHAQDIPLSEQWVYLSDKLFEQSGAYVIFRRCYYIGECEDFMHMSIDEAINEAIQSHTQRRMTKFKPSVFRDEVKKLAEYQYQWQQSFFSVFVAQETWATRLAHQFVAYGREKASSLEKLIDNFEPHHEHGEKFKQEALSYLKGDKYIFFKTLLFRP